jgi:hypothetical protein
VDSGDWVGEGSQWSAVAEEGRGGVSASAALRAISAIAAEYFGSQSRRWAYLSVIVLFKVYSTGVDNLSGTTILPVYGFKCKVLLLTTLVNLPESPVSYEIIRRIACGSPISGIVAGSAIRRAQGLRPMGVPGDNRDRGKGAWCPLLPQVRGP